MKEKKFTVKRQDSLAYDQPISLTEQERGKLPFRFHINFRDSGWKNLREGKAEAAMRDFHLAAAAAAEDDSRTLIGRAYARVKKGLFDGALKDAQTVLRSNDFDRDAIYLEAFCQVFIGNAEEGLVMYQRGTNKRGRRLEFEAGRLALEIGMENTIGRYAGPVLTNLQSVIQALMRRNRELQLEAEKPKPLCDDNLDGKTDDSNLKHKRNRPRRGTISRSFVYLGKLSEDKQWLQQLPSKMPPGPNKRSNERIKSLATAATEEIDRVQEIFEALKPSYHFEYMFLPCKAVADKKKEEDTAIMKVIKENMIKRMMERLEALRRQHRTKDCCFQAEQILEMLFHTKSRYIPQRRKVINELSQMMGLVFLDRKNLIPDYNDKDNKLRIKATLGIFPQLMSYSASITSHDSDFPFMNVHKWIKIFKEKLNSAKPSADQAWFQHELARLYITQGKMEHAAVAARKCVLFAKKSGSRVWAINGYIMIVITEMRRKEREEAFAALEESINMAIALKNESVIQCLLKTREVLKEKKIHELSIDSLDNNPAEKREKEIMALMDDPELRKKMKLLLTKNEKSTTRIGTSKKVQSTDDMKKNYFAFIGINPYSS